ncbi:MAG: dihydrolipoyl dehydrogenase [Prevotella sp.]
MNTDIIIIGSGPGGYKAAQYAARHGKTVTIIEREEAGGTCLNCGCIPTKTLCRNAEVLTTIADGEAYGIADATYRLDFTKVVERKNAVIMQLRGAVEALMSQPGITLVRGEATLKDAHTVVVGSDEYIADNIIIATGSRPRMLPIPGIDLEGVVTSTGLLDVETVPRRLCIIGAGVIGMEFASCFSRFGSEVTVVEFLKECLPVLDSDIAKRLRKQVKADFYMQSCVESIERNADGSLRVTFSKKNKTQTVDADMVLVATGRAANVEGLNLEAVGVEHGKTGITVDDNMLTSVPNIYAIGDVNGRCMLAHAATMQGFRAVNHILGLTDNIRLDIMPSAVFTIPEAASVGLSEDYCKEHGISYECRKAFHRANGKALAMNETEGLLKLIVEADTKRIIGCHAFGAHAADLIQEASVLMCKATTLPELHDMIHIHPTLSEILYSAAE